jgi:hypothetical protein
LALTTQHARAGAMPNSANTRSVSVACSPRARGLPDGEAFYFIAQGGAFFVGHSPIAFSHSAS